MQDIAPFAYWQDHYVSEEDHRSPFFGRTYSGIHYSQRIYNYYIHPQWDFFGSPTLYCKILFADYAKQLAIIELFGEWNDAIHNDIMHLKRNVGEPLMDNGISKFVFITENVLNFHASDDCYYQEWYEDVNDSFGWLVLLNLREHLRHEMEEYQITEYVQQNDKSQEASWRKIKPQQFIEYVEQEILGIRD